MITSTRRLFLLTAALLLAADSAFSANLGRLFYSPEERAALDAQRSQTAFVPGATGDTVTVNGLVTRSSGRSTTWINGVPRNENQSGDGVEVLRREAAGGKVTVRPPGKNAAVDVKVGQTLDGTTRKVREPYDRPSSSDEREKE